MTLEKQDIIQILQDADNLLTKYYTSTAMKDSDSQILLLISNVKSKIYSIICELNKTPIKKFGSTDKKSSTRSRL